MRLNALAVMAAAYDSYEISRLPSCLEGTRVELLEDLMGWVSSENRNQSIYILYGVAGAGKSTIAKTVAERAAQENALGATFFFSRRAPNRKTARWLFPTLAHHLVHYSNEFARSINEVLEEDLNAARRGIQKQFESLIARPFHLAIATQTPILIIIDALDECDEEGARIILALLAHKMPKSSRLKVFITARPERHIRTALNHYRHYQQFHMQDIEQLAVEADIRRYLDVRLSQGMHDLFPRIPPPWQPTRQQITALVRLSGKLFIVASTAVRFILDPTQTVSGSSDEKVRLWDGRSGRPIGEPLHGHSGSLRSVAFSSDGRIVSGSSDHTIPIWDGVSAPAKQISKLLDGISAKDFHYAEEMDKVYTLIIRSARPDPAVDWSRRFQKIVGAIVLLQDPLTCEALAKLLNAEVDEVCRTLSNLHSLLTASERDGTFWIYHKSFTDFITNQERCYLDPEFYINPALHHMRIAGGCLRMMNDNLTFNMCNLEAGEEYKGMQPQGRARNTIPPQLAYACIHWASHLVAGLEDDAGLNGEIRQLLEPFANQRLLNWLEALSIVGRVDTAYSSLYSALVTIPL